MTLPIDNLHSTFYSFVVSIVAGAICAYPILRALIALKSRQTIYSLAPQTHQVKQGTPTMGGIIILIALCLGVLVVQHDWELALWLLGFAFIGFSDDYIVPKLVKGKRGLGWKQKFLAQAVLAVLAAPVFGFGWNPWACALLAFIVMFFSNAYNFADGLDALAGSLGLLLCMGFSLLFTFTGQHQFLPILAALAGAYIPFLFLNAPPAKIFMGDVGSLPIGALFGALAAKLLIAESTTSVAIQPQLLLPVFLLSFIMIAELLPVPMQVGFYKLTKKRLFPMTPIHHSFEVKGWPESRVVWSFFLAQLTLVVLAVGTAAVIITPATPSAHVVAMEARH